jgi:hypothetical protein
MSLMESSTRSAANCARGAWIATPRHDRALTASGKEDLLHVDQPTKCATPRASRRIIMFKIQKNDGRWEKSQKQRRRSD